MFAALVSSASITVSSKGYGRHSFDNGETLKFTKTASQSLIVAFDRQPDSQTKYGNFDLAQYHTEKSDTFSKSEPYVIYIPNKQAFLTFGIEFALAKTLSVQYWLVDGEIVNPRYISSSGSKSKLSLEKNSGSNKMWMFFLSDNGQGTWSYNNKGTFQSYIRTTVYSGIDQVGQPETGVDYMNHTINGRSMYLKVDTTAGALPDMEFTCQVPDSQLDATANMALTISSYSDNFKRIYDPYNRADFSNFGLGALDTWIIIVIVIAVVIALIPLSFCFCFWCNCCGCRSSMKGCMPAWMLACCCCGSSFMTGAIAGAVGVTAFKAFNDDSSSSSGKKKKKQQSNSDPPNTEYVPPAAAYPQQQQQMMYPQQQVAYPQQQMMQPGYPVQGQYPPPNMQMNPYGVTSP